MSEPTPQAPAHFSAVDSGPLPLADAVERYLTANQSVRADRTRNSHRANVRLLGKHLGREPTVDDLNEQTIGEFWRTREESVTRNTVNGEASALLAVWKWLSVRQLSGPPTIDPPARVSKSPKALSLEQLRSLFHAAHNCKMVIGTVPGNLYWPALLSVLWQTAERIGAVRALQWEDIDLDAGWIRFPAGTRKFGTSELVRPITADAVEQLRRLKEASPSAPFDAMPGTGWYGLWHALRCEAGLPIWTRPHTIRKSVASHLPSLTDACEFLGHSTSAVTKRNYRDPTYGDGRALLAKLPSVDKPRGVLGRIFKR